MERIYTRRYWLLATVVVAVLFLVMACGRAAPTPTSVPTSTPLPTATATPTSAPPPTAVSTPARKATPTPLPTAAPTEEEEEEHGEAIVVEAAAKTITVDGDASDWADVPGTAVTLEQIEPIPGEEMGEVPPKDITLKVAADADNLYVLMMVPDNYRYNAEDHHLSPAVAVMLRIDPEAAPHMGVEEEDLERSLGMVDIWHWELDCGPGVLAGGAALEQGGVSGGNDPACNLDDEYSTTPEEREDDDAVSSENSILGAWEHTARAQGEGAQGMYVFEFSRPLQTGDPRDAQLSLGGEAQLALAYWDPDETADGWTGVGHIQSAEEGWIEVLLPQAS